VKRGKTDKAIAKALKAEAIRRAPQVAVTPQKLKKIIKRAKRGNNK
jgi:hypothetical protein